MNEKFVVKYIWNVGKYLESLVSTLWIFCPKNVKLPEMNPPPLSGPWTGKSDQKEALWQSYLGLNFLFYFLKFGLAWNLQQVTVKYFKP